MYLVKLIDKMNITKLKFVRILSDGSLNICYKYYTNVKPIEISEKDNKNFYFNKKKRSTKIHSESSFNYKKKYL